MLPQVPFQNKASYVSDKFVYLLSVVALELESVEAGGSAAGKVVVIAGSV